MLKSAILFLVIFVFTFTATPMSFFSSASRGVGLRQYMTTARGMGMGGVGLALPDNRALNELNVASWRNINDTRFSVHYRYEVNLLSFSNADFSSSSGIFNGAAFAVPIKKHKWVIGISILPYTLVDFSSTQTHSAGDKTYDENIFFKGGITRGQLNLVWSPTRRVGLAGSFHYYFGTIRDRYQNIFNSDEFYDSNTEMSYRFLGPGAGISADFQVFDSLFIGGFLDLKPDLTFTRTLQSPVKSEKEEYEASSTFPMSWGLGSSFTFAQKWTLAADVAFQKWSEGFDIPGIPLSQLDDWKQFSFGIEHAHLAKREKSFFNRMDLRAGFSFGNIGYKFNNQSVTEYAVHGGMGFPFYQDRARFDIALKAGIRGDQSNTIAQEKFFQFSLSVSGGELWFQKFR